MSIGHIVRAGSGAGWCTICTHMCQASSLLYRTWSSLTRMRALSDRLRAFWTQSVPKPHRRYAFTPTPEATGLRRALASYHRVRPEQVFAGNGSDEVLAHAFVALLKQNAPLLLPDITYGIYPAYCRLFGIQADPVPLDASLHICVADYSRSGGAIITPNPNAPTGIALSRRDRSAVGRTP